MDTIDKINALLKERGMNGAELSRAIGVSSAVYSQWNTRKTTPSNKNIAKVAAVLGVSVSELTMDGQKEKLPTQGGEPIGSNKQALLELVEQMSDDEMGDLLDVIKATLKMRGKK